MGKPSISGVNTNEMNDMGTVNQVSFGHRGVFDVNSSNGFTCTSVSGLVVSSITVTGDTAVIAFSGTPDLSEVEVGNYARIWGNPSNADNNDIDQLPITDVDTGAYTIDVTIAGLRMVTQAGAGGFVDISPFLGGAAIQCLSDTVFTSVVENNHFGSSYLATATKLEGFIVYGDFQEVTVASGDVRVYLK